MTSIHVTNAYHPSSGGIRTVYRALLDHANRHGRRVRLIVPGERDVCEDVGPFGRIYYVKAPRSLAFDSRYRLILPHRYLFGGPSWVRRILRHEQADVVEICDKYSLPYLAGLLRKGWIPGVPRPTLIGVSAERLDDSMASYLSDGAPAKAFARWYLRHIYAPPFDYHVANSEYTANELRDVLPDHRKGIVHVCPPGVDATGFHPERRSAGIREAWLRRAGGRADSVLLLYIGRVSPEKNVGLLIETIGRLCCISPVDYRLVVAGDGPELERVRARADDQAPGRVLFLGSVADREALRDLYANADVFIHPNPREPFGIAPLEAMASGTPVVLPNAGGVLTYASTANAWLAEPDARGFSHAVLELLTDPAEASRRSAAGRATAERFTWEKSACRLFDLFDRLHAARRGPDQPFAVPALSTLSSRRLAPGQLHEVSEIRRSACLFRGTKVGQR